MGENKELEVRQTQFKNSKLIQFPVIGLPAKSSSNINSLEDRIEEFGKGVAVDFAANLTGGEIPKQKLDAVNNTKFNPGSLAAFAGTLFEASVGSMLGDKGFADYNAQSIGSAFDIKVNEQLKETFPSLAGVDYVELKGRKNKTLMDSVAKKIYQVTEGQRAAQSTSKLGYNELKELGMQRPLSDLDKKIVIENGKITEFKSVKELENYVSSKYTKNAGNSTIAGTTRFSENVWPSIGPRTKKGADGYIPNFADPLKDAVQREMDAGLDPAQIRITKDLRLKNAQNPNGFAVINTRDEPDGKIPNFADPISLVGAKSFQTQGVPMISGPAALPSKELEALRKELNALIATFEKEVQSGTELITAQKTLTEGTKKLTDKYNLDTQTTQKVGSAVDVSASKIKAPEQKQFDVGKFLLFQTAMAGATSAIQSFTDEGSKAS
jgi:hypothetical protein